MKAMIFQQYGGPEQLVLRGYHRRLTAGTSVAAILGGMGRNRNGSYAEYTAVPATPDGVQRSQRKNRCRRLEMDSRNQI